MKITIWEISGYKGFDNYDGACDDNMKFCVAMDSRFSQKGVEDIFLNIYSKKYRCVALKATKVNETIVENI